MGVPNSATVTNSFNGISSLFSPFFVTQTARDSFISITVKISLILPFFLATRRPFFTGISYSGVHSGRCSSKTRPNFFCFPSRDASSRRRSRSPWSFTCSIKSVNADIGLLLSSRLLRGFFSWDEVNNITDIAI